MDKNNHSQKKIFHSMLISFCYLARKHQKLIFKKLNFYTKGQIKKEVECMLGNDL